MKNMAVNGKSSVFEWVDEKWEIFFRKKKMRRKKKS